MPAQTDWSIHLAFMGNFLSKLSACGERSIRLDCPNAQIDLGLHVLIKHARCRLCADGLMQVCITIVKSCVPHKNFSFELNHKMLVL